jgi:ABC-type long-subunit fatty acid transport system fused permease/ATPase subunit
MSLDNQWLCSSNFCSGFGGSIEAFSQESPTIIPSKPTTLLKAYQMKLVSQKMKNLKEKVQQLIQTMMSVDDKLNIDPFYTDTRPETSRVILVQVNIPTEDKYFARYFIDMNDRHNKEGMTLFFWITLEHSHVKWHSHSSAEL